MVEDEFRFGNIPAVMFVNVKGMKKVVRKGAVCLDNTFAGGGCLQGPVALTHQPNCPLCSFSFEIVGDASCIQSIGTMSVVYNRQPLRQKLTSRLSNE